MDPMSVDAASDRVTITSMRCCDDTEPIPDGRTSSGDGMTEEPRPRKLRLTDVVDCAAHVCETGDTSNFRSLPAGRCLA